MALSGQRVALLVLLIAGYVGAALATQQVSSPISQEVQERLERGVALENIGFYEEAEAEFLAALAAAESTSTAQVTEALQRVREAQSTAETDRQDQSSQKYLDLGEALQKEGHFGEALEALRRAYDEANSLETQARAQAAIASVLNAEDSWWEFTQDCIELVAKLFLILPGLYILYKTLGFIGWVVARFSKRIEVARFDDTTDTGLGRGFPALLHTLYHDRKQLADWDPTLPGSGIVTYRGESVTQPIMGSPRYEDFSEIKLEVGGVAVSQLLSKAVSLVRQPHYSVSGVVYCCGNEVHAAVTLTKYNGILEQWDFTLWNDKLSRPALVDSAYQVINAIIKDWNTVVMENHTDSSNSRATARFLEGMKLLRSFQTERDREHLSRAVDNFAEAVDIDPRYRAARFYLGVSEELSLKHEEAAKHFEQLRVQSEQPDLELLYNLGLAYFHQYHPAAYNRAIEYLERVIELTDEVTSGIQLEETEQHRRETIRLLAKAVLAQVHSHFSIPPPGVPADEADKHFKEALQIASSSLEEFERGKDRLEQALVNDIGWNLHNAIGHAYLYAGKREDQSQHFEKSVSELKSALQCDPNNYRVLSNLGSAHLYLAKQRQGQESKKQLALAEQLFQRVLLIEPDYDFAYSRLSKTALLRGDLDEAERYADLAKQNRREMTSDYIGKLFRDIKQARNSSVGNI